MTYKKLNANSLPYSVRMLRDIAILLVGPKGKRFRTKDVKSIPFSLFADKGKETEKSV